jgi:formylglycine-generating enzyme required for sulfatase activity
MQLVYIPPGTFTMGSPKSEQDWVRKTFGNDAGDRAALETQHEVQIAKGFHLGKYAVTQGEYQRVMGTNPSSFSPFGSKKQMIAGLSDASRLPVERVSWNDAKEFCRKLSLREGVEYRLPREEEWEYACRAGTKTAYNVGGTLTAKDANIDLKKGRPVAVGSYAPNAWGLFDMHGNVWQWCEDYYERDRYGKNQPLAGSAGTRRVSRGGSWGEDARYCRSAYRDWNLPESKDSYLGFRIALPSAR